MDRNGPCKSRGSIILWIRKEEPSGGGVDGSRRLGGREDGGILLWSTYMYFLQLRTWVFNFNLHESHDRILCPGQYLGRG